MYNAGSFYDSNPSYQERLMRNLRAVGQSQKADRMSGVFGNVAQPYVPEGVDSVVQHPAVATAAPYEPQAAQQLPATVHILPVYDQHPQGSVYDPGSMADALAAAAQRSTTVYSEPGSAETPAFSAAPSAQQPAYAERTVASEPYRPQGAMNGVVSTGSAPQRMSSAPWSRQSSSVKKVPSAYTRMPVSRSAALADKIARFGR